MLPLRLDEPARRVPWTTLAITLAYGLAFLWSRSQSREVLRALYLDPAAFSPIQLFTSSFLHADVFHLAGNLVFLLVFGRYVEERCGPWRFLLLYLVFELGGNLAFLGLSWATSRDAAALGASAAISGTLGFTLVAIPRARVVVCWFPTSTGALPRLPVVLYLSLWLGLQAIQLMGTPYMGLGSAAHLGGFLTGVVLAVLLFSEHTAGTSWHLERDPAGGSVTGRATRSLATLYGEAAEALRAERGGGRVRYVEPVSSQVEEAPSSTESTEGEAPPATRAVPRRRREDDWTLAEGAISVLRFLGVRLLFVLPLSVAIQGGLLAPMSHLPSVGLLMILFGVALGMVLGALLSWGLIRRVHFVGWIPTGMAVGAAEVAVFGGYALAQQWNPIQGAANGPLALIMLSIGAAAAIYRVTALE